MPRATDSARRLLHAVVLFSVAVFPCISPGIGLLVVTESEAPVDQDETEENAAVNVQARTRGCHSQPSIPLLVGTPARFSLTSNNDGAGHFGHRLSNHLLAPLRC